MFFGTNLGTLSSQLIYEKEFSFSKFDVVINSILMVIAFVVLLVTMNKYKKFVTLALTTGIFAVIGMTAVNMNTIYTSISPLKEQAVNIAASMPEFTLSKAKNNVIVLMMDRAMGPYIPYLVNEKPELMQKFDGFTYYENTVSHGGYTNFGAPALFGEYEYTPSEMNARDTESLASKHNEALKVMPVLFDQNGYNVTVCDVPYGNYQWITDLSIYDEYPNINKYKTIGRFNSTANGDAVFVNNCRNFFCYSLTKSAPLAVQPLIYDNGRYYGQELEGEYVSQSVEGSSVANGIDKTFMDSYNVLKSLDKMTQIDNDSNGAFVMMNNETTHALSLLQEPEYEPKESVNNTEYDENNVNRFDLNDKKMDMSSDQDYEHYEMNMASLIQLGNWFDYLRANGVYDNTKIIIVSDHGRNLGQFDELKMNTGNDNYDLEYYTPLLMVKDFNSTGFKTSDEFMTNGDVPTIATSGAIENAINPFTGKQINADDKTAHDQYVIVSEECDVSTNNGTQFIPADWLSVHGR